MKTPLRQTSSDTLTSSASIVSGSTLHQDPTQENQAMIDPDIQALDPIFELGNRIEFLILAPAPTTQFSPIDTFGPITAVGSIFAEG